MAIKRVLIAIFWLQTIMGYAQGLTPAQLVGTWMGESVEVDLNTVVPLPYRDYARALTHLQAYDDRTPNFDDPIDDYSVNYLKGRAYAGLGDHKNALKAYTLTISQRATRLGMEWVDYRYLVARGMSYLAQKQAINGLSDFELAIKNYPKSSMAHYHRGRALEQLSRLEEAKTAYRDARFFLLSNNAFERDYYYEQPDAAYEEDIDEALARLK